MDEADMNDQSQAPRSPTMEAEWAERTLRAMFDAHVRVNGPSCEREHELLTAALGWARDEGRREAAQSPPYPTRWASEGPIKMGDASESPHICAVTLSDGTMVQLQDAADLIEQRIAGLNASESPPHRHSFILQQGATCRCGASRDASESPPTHIHDWTASTQPGAWPGMPGSVCVAPGHVGDASESPPTEQHGHWWETRHCPACNTAGAHTVMGADDMPDHRWDGQRVWDASESPPTEQAREWLRTDDGCTCTGCKERRERHEATVGDASESGPAPGGQR